MSLEESIKDDRKKSDKEERRRRKQEKRAAREAKAAASTVASDSKTTDVSRMEKKDRKRKRDGLGDIAAVDSSKQLKREEDGRDMVAVRKVEREERKKPAADTAQPAINGTESDPSLSKKQSKKLARAAATSNTPVLTVSPSTPQPFTTAQQSYLSTHAITLTPSHFPPHLSISSLPVHNKFVAFLGQFKEPTPIQACSWPPLLAGRDVIGIAETGSGKTLAFGVPGLDRIVGKEKIVGTGPGDERLGMGKKGKGAGWISMLVLAPTRELAQQSHETLVALGKGVGVRSVCLFGGVGKEDQLGSLRKQEVKIVVGTPGRTLDLADAGNLDLSK